MNSHHKGILHFVIFKTPKDKEYTGVCYELSLVLTDSDPEKLESDLTDMAKHYVKTVRQRKLSAKLLNQENKLPREYKTLFKLFNVATSKTNKAIGYS